MAKFEFSDEAKLFQQEHDLVRHMETAWQRDIDAFYQALHSALPEAVQEQLTSKSVAPSYVHWCNASWKGKRFGELRLWRTDYPTELIRDRKLVWFAYAKEASPDRATVHQALIDEGMSRLGPFSWVQCFAFSVKKEFPLKMEIALGDDCDPVTGADRCSQVIAELDKVVAALDARFGGVTGTGAT